MSKKHPRASGLPKSLLAEIGQLANTWAHIQQELLMQSSALSSKSTGGYTTTPLPIAFDRLRKHWFAEMGKYVSTKNMNQHINKVSGDLGKLARVRNYAVHGLWVYGAPGKYEVVVWEQLQTLTRKTAKVTLKQLKRFNVESLALYGRLYKASNLIP